MAKKKNEEGAGGAVASVIETIHANALRLAEATFSIEGVGSGVISNNFSDEAADEIEGKKSRKAGAQAVIANPEEQIRRSLRIRSEDAGKPIEQCPMCISGAGMRKAIAAAAGMLAGQRKITKSGLLRAFHVKDDLILVNGKWAQRRDHVHGGHIVYRAWVPNHPNKPWTAEFTIIFDEGQISKEILVDLINCAGFGVGVGGWRSERGGAMGMFRVSVAGK